MSVTKEVREMLAMRPKIHTNGREDEDYLRRLCDRNDALEAALRDTLEVLSGMPHNEFSVHSAKQTRAARQTLEG